VTTTRTIPRAAVGRPGFRTRLIIAQVAIVVATVAAITALVAQVQHGQLRAETSDRVLAVAQSLAELPAVRDAVAADDAESLQRTADLLSVAAGVDYVVITDETGARFTHPVASQRGLPVSTSPDRVLAGETFLGTEVGTLGPSLRAKVPIRDDDGLVVGTASVGLLESGVASRLGESMAALAPWMLSALALGVSGALLVGISARRRFARLESELSLLDGQRSVSAALSAHAHEFANRIHVVYGLVSRGESRLALDYIDTFATVGGPDGAGAGVAGSVSGIGEPALEALLAAKSARAGDEGKHLVVTARLGDGGGPRPPDDDLITVVGNLVGNALDAVHSGGTVRVDLQRSGRSVVAVVADDGPGIDPGDRARVFERGFSTKAGASSAGAERGIGLALVRQIVDRRGGQVSIDQEADAGARFTVRLPVATPAALPGRAGSR